VSYLRKEAPPRRIMKGDQARYLTDRDREEIDAQTKDLLRKFNARIVELAAAEQLRQQTETNSTVRKYARLGLGALGSWAAGGAGHTKSYEQEEEEKQLNAFHTHRESVLWYLRQKLQQTGALQAGMMEVRINREMEKNRSILGKSRLAMPELGGFDNTSASPTSASAVHLDTQEKFSDQNLTEEQVQMFEKENQDMLSHYQSTLEQVM
jgi:syntaxin 18